MLNPTIARRPRALALTAMLLLTALLSALLVALTSAPAANAHTPVADATCTSLDVSATNYGGNARNHATVVIDGETVADEEFGARYTESFAWDPTVDHEWSVTIDQGDGNQYDFSDSGTQVACEEPPTTVQYPAQPALQDVCGPEYTVPALPEDAAYAWTVDRSDAPGGVGTVVITATLHDGFVWAGGATDAKSWTYDVTSEPCVTGEIPTPTFQEICGPDGEAPYTLPDAVEHVRYDVTDPGTYVDGARVVQIVAVFDEGYAAPEGATTSWTHTFREEPCDVPVAGIATADVVVTPASCTAPGTAATGATERASWTVTDVPAAGGRATFVAVAEEGAAFTAGLPGVSDDLTTRTFTVDVPAAGGELCTTATPPVQPPTQATPPTTTQAGPPTLPRTGFDISSILVLGSLLAAAGTALVVRRVRAQG